MSETTSQGQIEITAPVSPAFAEILTPDALNFVATLMRAFGSRRAELLARREQRQHEIDLGKRPDFLAETVRLTHENFFQYRSILQFDVTEGYVSPKFDKIQQNDGVTRD